MKTAIFIALLSSASLSFGQTASGRSAPGSLTPKKAAVPTEAKPPSGQTNSFVTTKTEVN